MTNSIRHKCFVSYHHGDPIRNDGDQRAVENFVSTFSAYHEVFISRAVGIDQDIVNSSDNNYIMRRIRERYLADSTVTIVLIGKCTWARKYVDWEIASSLRNDPINKRSGLLAIQLPNISDSVALPPRLKDNWDSGYAKYYRYPTSPSSLESMINEAFEARTNKSNLVDNSRELFGYNRNC